VTTTQETRWLEKVTGKFLSLFTQKEVKTPLSFFFRIVTAASTIILAGMYLVGPDPNLRFKILELAISVLLFLFIAVYVFALVRPKNLVYGETGHRAEMKFAMGTENHEMGAAEVASIEGTTNPKSLSSAGGL
jgi:hypothetical protein